MNIYPVGLLQESSKNSFNGISLSKLTINLGKCIGFNTTYAVREEGKVSSRSKPEYCGTPLLPQSPPSLLDYMPLYCSGIVACRHPLHSFVRCSLLRHDGPAEDYPTATTRPAEAPEGFYVDLFTVSGKGQ